MAAPRYEVGARVGAIFSSTSDGTVLFLGYGRYEGEEVPEEAAGWLAQAMRENGLTNPVLSLDSGERVYGCECWWGPEEQIRKTLEGKKVQQVSIVELREKAKKAETTEGTN